jgi:hypothetical protein
LNVLKWETSVILEVRCSALRVAEGINNATRNNCVLHRLINFCFQVFCATQIITNDIRGIEQFLPRLVNDVCKNSKGKYANLLHLFDHFLSLGRFLAKFSLMKILADLHTGLDMGADKGCYFSCDKNRKCEHTQCFLRLV